MAQQDSTPKNDFFFSICKLSNILLQKSGSASASKRPCNCVMLLFLSFACGEYPALWKFVNIPSHHGPWTIFIGNSLHCPVFRVVDEFPHLLNLRQNRSGFGAKLFHAFAHICTSRQRDRKLWCVRDLVSARFRLFKITSDVTRAFFPEEKSSFCSYFLLHS